MNRLFRFIRYLGVVGSYDSSKQKSIILMNEVIFVTIVFLILFSIVDISYNKSLGVGSTVAILTIFASLGLYVLNFKYQTNLSKAIMCSTFPVGITILNLIFSNKINMNYFFLLSIVIVMLLYRKVLPRVIFVTFNTLCCFVVLYYKSFFGTTIIQDNWSYTMNAVSIIYAHCVALFILIRFSTVGDAIKFQLTEVLNKVKESHEILRTKQQQVEEQHVQLEKTNQELEKFAYIASHDLKSPLRNITSFMNLIQRKLKNYPDESILEYLSFATSSAKQMHFLVNDILEYSKLGDKKIEIQTVDLNDILTKVKQSIQAIIDEKQAVIETDELPTIHANETQVTLLFQNLIENGIKYNTSETPTVRVQYASLDDKHLIRVEDNGIGIPKEFQQKVFEMFQRLHTQEQAQGSGIGLAICMKIVEQHHGRLWLESEEGQGAIFFVELPKIQIDA